MHRSAKFQRFLLIGLSGPVVALNIWILSQVFHYFDRLITVLTVAGILAFLLNYPVRLFERLRFQRSQAVIIVLLLTLTLLIFLGITLLPILIDQSTGLLKNIPNWLRASNENLELLDRWAKARGLPLDLKGFSYRISVRLESQAQTLASQAVGFAFSTVSGLLDFVFVLVLAFYMLLYGDHVWQSLVKLLPPEIGLPLSRSIQLNFHNFFLSQLLLGLFMVVTLTPIFLALKVPFTFLFALLIGIAQLIPIIGATLGIGLVTLLVMLKDFGLAVWVAIASITIQQIKDNLIAPKLMGEFTGLNPIWIFISILMGAQIAGLLGIVVAVPIAGTFKDTIDTIRRLRQPILANDPGAANSAGE
jgi:predicted PurR-regulated permease PerM